MGRTFEEYQQEKSEREWNDKVKKQKEAMGNAERVKRAADWKRRGNDKFKAGNLWEARDYYREAIIFIEDLVDARRQERTELLMPLYTNLAQVHLKLDELKMAEDVTTNAVKYGEVPRNGVSVGLRAKAHFRRALARRRLDKAEDAAVDLSAALKLEPSNAEVQQELQSVGQQLKEAAREAKASNWMGGFLNKAQAAEDEKAAHEARRTAEERRRAERRAERKAKAEERQRMQKAFEKMSQEGTPMLYEQREKEMAPVRVKEAEKKKTLELERDLLNIIDDSQGRGKTEDFDKFMKQKEQRALEQSDELDQKKKILDKQKKEREWEEDDAWQGQRQAHRERLEQERESGALPAAGPPQLWSSPEVGRWCEQRLRDLLVKLSVESPLDDEALCRLDFKQKEGGRLVLKAIVTDVLKVHGEAQVMRLNPYRPPLHYWDYFLKLDWEVAASQPGTDVYRTAQDLIAVASKSDDWKAPASVASDRLLAGTFKVREFCSEELPEAGAPWPFLTKVKATCDRGPHLQTLAEAARDQLLTLVNTKLSQWVDEYRDHWKV